MFFNNFSDGVDVSSFVFGLNNLVICLGNSSVYKSNFACLPFASFMYPLIPIITIGGVETTVPRLTSCFP